jgi:hypothetical protein
MKICVICKKPIDTANEQSTVYAIEIPDSYHRECFCLKLHAWHEESMEIIKRVMAEQVYA